MHRKTYRLRKQVLGAQHKDTQTTACLMAKVERALKAQAESSSTSSNPACRSGDAQIAKGRPWAFFNSFESFPWWIFMNTTIRNLAVALQCSPIFGTDPGQRTPTAQVLSSSRISIRTLPVELHRIAEAAAAFFCGVALVSRK
jgi:hypothetical protein